MKPWHDRYWTSRDGLRLHYRDYDGPSDRTPLLCLHGVTRNARDFEAFAERYAGEWRVIAPDFRGRSLSERDPDPSRYMPVTYAGDILQLLDEIAVDEAIFVGTSLGALVTMLVGQAAPQRIAGAVINDIGPELDPDGLERIRSYIGKQSVFAGWDEAATAFEQVFGQVHPRYGRTEWLRYAKRVGRETDSGVELDYDMAIADAFSTANATPAPDLWPLLDGLAGKPVLIIRGERSDLLSAGVAETMRQRLAGAELATIPDVGHAPDFEEPETIAAVDRLLRRVSGGIA